jgi:transmembrane sensor
VSDDLRHRLARARTHLEAGFDDGDVERSLSSLQRRIQRRQRARQAGLAASALSLLVVVWFTLGAPKQAPLAEGTPAASVPGASAALTVRHTRDGSFARALELGTQLQVQQDGEHEVALSLLRGASHFEVTKRAERRYHVHAGEIDVLVLGTVFDVKRRGARSEVTVQHGAVEVSWPSGKTILRAGESDWFPRAEVAATAAPAESLVEASAQAYAAEQPTGEGVSSPDTAAVAPPSPKAHKHDAWRTLARAGKHGEAFRTLDRAPVEDLEGLLLAADAARLSGHPREAALYLERLVARYPSSASARLGAFTLAGLLLHELGNPARAARSYARAYQLDPQGPLAQDALAREAEAYGRAGQRARAKQAAELYLTRFPEGVRRSELQRYLGE